ncbi:MAG: preprotein translocase subunit SecE [Gammaproteobacteria bacterium]|jgi:preprotein translocase subunit SecE
MMDKVKLAISILLVVGGIVGFYWYADQVALLYRVLGLLVVIGVAVAIAVTSAQGQQVVAFGRAASMEMRKTVWPTRKETTQTTLIVVVFVTILGAAIWIIDSVLRLIVARLI